MKIKLLNLLLCLVFIGCVSTTSNTPTSITYNSFKTGEIAYKNGLTMANDLHKQGKISDEDVTEIIQIAKDYKTAYVAASIAFETWKEEPTLSNEESLEQLKKNAELMLVVFKRWIYERQ